MNGVRLRLFDAAGVVLSGWIAGSVTTAMALSLWAWIAGLVDDGSHLATIGQAVIRLPIALFFGVGLAVFTAVFSAPWALSIGSALIGVLSYMPSMSGAAIILVSAGVAALAGVVIELSATTHFWLSGFGWAAPVYGIAQGWFHSRKTHG